MTRLPVRAQLSLFNQEMYTEGLERAYEPLHPDIAIFSREHMAPSLKVTAMLCGHVGPACRPPLFGVAPLASMHSGARALKARRAKCSSAGSI